MIYAIIVTYNPDRVILKKQYNSLVNQVDKIIYIDNGSKECIIDNFKNCIFIRNIENLGLGKAQNQGIEISLSDNADFVILFDQDSIPPVDFVTSLISVYKEATKRYKTALVAPLIKNAFLNGESENYGIIINNIKYKKVKLERLTKVSYCIASGSLIPTKVLEEIGKIKEELFIDNMDFEWCLRAKSKGYEIIQTNETYLSHRLGEGDRDFILSHSPFREYYIIRNNIIISKLPYIPIGYRCRRIISTFFRIIISVIRCRWVYVKQQLKGLLDGYRFKKG